jgi:hypothetical protein
VFRSSSPASWEVTDKVKWMDWHVPVIVREVDGQRYITLCGYERERKGFSLARLEWNDYLEEAPSSVAVPGRE